MPLRDIIVDGDERLRKKAKFIDDPCHPRIQTLIDDMIETLHDSGNGVGLAAVQVGVLRRLFIIDMGDERGCRIYINPEIIAEEGEQCQLEGCLSVPDKWGQVVRPAQVTVRAQDRQGQWFEEVATGLDAICICHENDHLNGILFTDQVQGELVET